MDLELEGKVGIVWGGSEGIGKAIARELLAEGMSLVVLGRKRERLDAARKELHTPGRLRTEVGDFRVHDDIRRAVDVAQESFGRLDVLVNNDGAPPIGPVAEFTDRDWEDAIERNFLSVVRSTRAALPVMLAGNGGSIVNITALSVLQPLSGLGLSVATWASVIAFSKTLAIECGQSGIRINTICPGRVNTRRVNLVVQQRADNVGVAEESDPAASVPLGRLGDPSEVAALAAFLSSPKSGFITGAAIPVDGGSRRSLF
jgi:3-oxoacyl-[acyl-carrier protein] reductase